MLGFFYSFPHGAVWGNVLVIPVVAVFGWVWSKTKFWPIRPLTHAVGSLHQKVDVHFAKVHQHNEWMARQQAKHMRATGVEPDEHPHLKDL